MAALLDALLDTLPDGQIEAVCIGLHWTMVAASVGGEMRAGLASTLNEGHEHRGSPDVPQAGTLHTLPGRELAGLIREDGPVLRSVGMAAINALLPRQPDRWTDVNAEDVIAARGAGRTVALIGRFPFIASLRPRVGSLVVLEQQPQGDELPSDAAPDILPHSDVVAITSMTFINRTAEGLLSLCPPHAEVLMLGPSTPLSPLLFDYGVTILSGAVIEDAPPILRAVEQGANFRQLHRAGVRLVTMQARGATYS